MAFLSRKLLLSRKSGLDQYWNYVKLLVRGVSSWNSNTTWIEDSLNILTYVQTSGSNNQGTLGTISPFTLNGLPYDGNIHGASTQFGYGGFTSGKQLNGYNTRFNFSSGTFTIEFWINFTSNGGTQFIIGNTGTGASGWAIKLVNGKLNAYLSGDSNPASIIGNQNIVSDTWYHIAVSGITGSYKLFIDGTQDGSTYTSTTSLVGIVLNFGVKSNGTTSPLFAYLSNFRITNNQVYTTNFTRPTSLVGLTSNGGAIPSNLPGLTSSSVPMLLNFVSGGILDLSKNNNIVLTNAALRQTIPTKFGVGGSLRLAATTTNSGSASTFSSSIFNFGTQDFTVEFWLYINTLTNSYIFSNAGTGLSIVLTSTGILEVRDGLAAIITTSPISVITISSWKFVAVSRYNNNIYLWVDGALRGSVTYTGSFNITPTNSIGIGCFSYNSSPLSTSSILGNVEEFRVTLGVARYTSPNPIPIPIAIFPSS